MSITSDRDRIFSDRRAASPERLRLGVWPRRAAKWCFWKRGALARKPRAVAEAGCASSTAIQRETPSAINAVQMWAEMDETVLDEDLEYDRGGNIKLVRSPGRAEPRRRPGSSANISQGLGGQFHQRRRRPGSALPMLSSKDIPLVRRNLLPQRTARPIRIKVTKAIGRAAARSRGAAPCINEPVLADGARCRDRVQVCKDR